MLRWWWERKKGRGWREEQWLRYRPWSLCDLKQLWFDLRFFPPILRLFRIAPRSTPPRFSFHQLSFRVVYHQSNNYFCNTWLVRGTGERGEKRKEKKEKKKKILFDDCRNISRSEIFVKAITWYNCVSIGSSKLASSYHSSKIIIIIIIINIIN